LFRNKSHGVTLLELIIAIAIIGILGSLAVPAFDNQIKDSKLISNTNLVVGAFNIARSEAINRGVQVKVNNIANGWAVTDVVTGEVLNQFEPSDNGITWTPAVFPDVIYNTNGFRPFGSQPVTIQLVDSRGIGRIVTVSAAGSTKVAMVP